MKSRRPLFILCAITVAILIYVNHTSTEVLSDWEKRVGLEVVNEDISLKQYIKDYLLRIHYLSDAIIEALPFLFCLLIGRIKKHTSWSATGWLLFIFWLLHQVDSFVLLPACYHLSFANFLGNPALHRKMDDIFRVIAYIPIIYWWVYRKAGNLYDSVFRDRKVSNIFIVIWIIGCIWVTIKLLLPYFILVIGGIPFHIGTILSYIGAFIVAYYVLNLNAFTLPFVYRCPKCHGFENTIYEGEFYDGVKAKKDYKHSSGTEVSEASNMIRETTTTTHKHITRYYEVLANVYTCGECGEQWKRTREGEYLGKDVRVKKEVEKKTFKF